MRHGANDNLHLRVWTWFYFIDGSGLVKRTGKRMEEKHLLPPHLTRAHAGAHPRPGHSMAALGSAIARLAGARCPLASLVVVGVTVARSLAPQIGLERWAWSLRGALKQKQQRATRSCADESSSSSSGRARNRADERGQQQQHRMFGFPSVERRSQF